MPETYDSSMAGKAPGREGEKDMRLSKRSGVLARIGVPAALVAAGVLSAPKESAAQGGPPPVGGPLPGLSQAELNRWNAGRATFLSNATPQRGLGPVFNAPSCAQCHRGGAPGGSSVDTGVSVVRRIGAMVNGSYSDLESVGGALIQSRSLREIIPAYPVPGETVPAQAMFVSRRQTTPTFGNGLMEAIPAASILSRQDPNDTNRDGISGKPNMVLNPETRVMEVGRFGWKCQVTSLHVFSADASRNELGITNPLFPTEVLPQGRPIPPGADTALDPEDRTGQGVNQLTDFMRFNAAPPQLLNLSARGRALFTSVQCAACHTPSMTTGANPSPALANKAANLYSDLLVHDMGNGLADGVKQGTAEGFEWRTAPLWGLRFRPFLLHDGRARTPDAAIRAHGGEAAASVGRYAALSASDRQELLNFILGL